MQHQHCCDMMQYFAEYRCDVHQSRFDCPDCIIHFDGESHRYGIIIHDGGSGWISIKHCPWCGKKL